MNDRTYGGYRVEPCFISPVTGRTLSSPKGWRSVDLNPGYTGMVGGTWFSSLDDFRHEVDQRYERLRGAVLGTRSLRDNEIRDFRGALTRLPAEEAQRVQAMLERGVARTLEALAAAHQKAHEQQEKARKEAALLKAAPDLLAALQHLIDSTTESIGPDGYRALRPPARSALDQAFAAIAKATVAPQPA